MMGRRVRYLLTGVVCHDTAGRLCKYLYSVRDESNGTIFCIVNHDKYLYERLLRCGIGDGEGIFCSKWAFPEFGPDVSARRCSHGDFSNVTIVLIHEEFDSLSQPQSITILSLVFLIRNLLSSPQNCPDRAAHPL